MIGRFAFFFQDNDPCTDYIVLGRQEFVKSGRAVSICILYIGFDLGGCGIGLEKKC